MSFSYQDQLLFFKEDLKQISHQLALLNGFIKIKYDKEFSDFSRSFEVSANDELIKSSSLNTKNKRPIRQKRNPVLDSVKTELFTSNKLAEETETPGNHEESNFLPITNAYSLADNSQSEASQNNISFDFETTNEYYPEEYQEPDAKNDEHCMKTTEESETISLQINAEDFPNSIEITEGIMKVEVTGDDLDIDGIYLNNNMVVFESNDEDYSADKDDFKDEDYNGNLASDTEHIEEGKKTTKVIKKQLKSTLSGKRKKQSKQTSSSSASRVQCEVSNSAFDNESRLAMDKRPREHFGDTQESNFKCSFCSKPFMYRSLLENHIRIHTNERPFKCPECSKGFREMSSLRCHLRIHSDEKPYKCSLCNEKFRFTSNLRYHKRKCHS